MKQEKLDELVESWGSMGALWGINRSTARVHALLIATEEPLSLDDLSEQLEISRGNASMCLKELRAWGVIKRVHARGDRKDYFVTEPEVWTLFFRILSHRKEREFDPLLKTLNAVLADGDAEDGPAAHARLEEMAELLATLDKLAARFLVNERASRAMIGFIAGLPQL